MSVNVDNQAFENAEIKDDPLHPSRWPPSSGKIGGAMFMPIRDLGQDRTNTCLARHSRKLRGAGTPFASAGTSSKMRRLRQISSSRPHALWRAGSAIARPL